MLSLRCSIAQVTFTPITSQGSYPEYIAMFDQLTDDRVIWTPYTTERLIQRAPDGLSLLCTRDYEYWYTRSPLVHDVFVEEYQVQRVMRQFGLRQEIPAPWGGYGCRRTSMRKFTCLLLSHNVIMC